MLSYIAYLVWAAIAYATYVTIAQGKLPRPAAWALGAAVIGVGFLGMAYLTRPPAYDVSNDFRVYYRAGVAALADPQELVRGDYGFVNVPILSLLFMPFTALSQAAAAKVYAVLAAISVLAGFVLLHRNTPSDDKLKFATAAVLAVSGPMLHSIWYGNLSHALIFPLTLGAILLGRDRQVPAGVLFALCALIKLPLMLLAPFIFLRGFWRATFAMGITGFSVVGASVALYGLPLNLAWVEHVTKFLGKAVPAYNVQSVTGFLVRLTHDFGPNLRNWDLFTPAPAVKLVNTTALLLLLLVSVVSLWRAKRPRGLSPVLFEVAAVVCLAFALSSLSWSHYYALLWLPAALLIGRWAGGEMSKLEAGVLVAALLLLGMPVVTDPPPASLDLLNQIYRRAFISHTVIGGLMLLGLVLATRLRQGRSTA